MIEIHYKRRISPSTIGAWHVFQRRKPLPLFYDILTVPIKVDLLVLLIPSLLRRPLLRNVSPGSFSYAPLPAEEM
jgi:hypothetical protein